MAKKVIKQISARLTELPVTVATGDTVENATSGVLTLVIGKEMAEGDSIVVRAKEGTEIELRPGETSAAITLAGGEKVFALDTYQGTHGTADKLFA